MRNFPRTTEDLVVLQGSLYNRMMDELERLSRFTVAPPLRLQDVPGGRLLTVAIGQTMFVRITGNTQDGTNKRWKYDWQEVVKRDVGYTASAWFTLSSGREGHNTTFGYCYNGIEYPNVATGTYGNGVASSNLLGTSLAIQPIPVGVVLPAFVVVPNSESALPEVWVTYENAIDGSCT
jgi:hypothetical protein